MATTSSAIQKKIETLKKGLNNKFITASQKEKIKSQVEKLESQAKASAPKKASKPAATSLTRLQKMVNKKKYGIYKGAGVDLQKDSDRPAKAIGKRTSKSGKTYYEYRANRIDVKQPPKRYPKLEKGGYMAKGGKTKKGDVGKSGTQYGYTLKEYEEMAEKNGLFVSPKEWWSSREGKKYTDNLGRTKTIGSNSQDERQEMQSYGYRIAIGMDLGSDKIPASARKYVIENNLTKEEQKKEKGGKIAVRNEGVDEISEMGGKRYGVEIQDEESGDVLDYEYFDSEEEAEDFVNKYKRGGYMADGGRIKGRNNETGESYGVVIGSVKKADEFDGGGIQMNVRNSYDSRISESTLYFDNDGNLISITNYGSAYDGKYPSTGYGSGTNYNGNKKETLEILSKKYNPAFAKKLIELAKNPKMAEGGMTEHGLKIGDTIVDNIFWDDSIKVLNNKTGYAVVDLEHGKRKDEMAKGGYMAEGGVTAKEVVESNADMVLSQIKAVKHHAEELSSVVSRKSNIEAWVVGKIERASTDLSDITHYLEGNKDKMSMGGTVRHYAHKMDKK
jgi:hypothetical protein